MTSLIAVTGPTASGKSAVAMELASRLGGEIVCCDSMQIYRSLDIGTAKPSAADRDAVPHHLTDFVEPERSYSVSDYCRDAREVIGALQASEKLPVLCGGTGLYYSSLVKGIDFTDESGRDEALTEALRQEVREFGIGKLVEELRKADPEHARQLDPGNEKRIIRSVELLRTKGITTAMQTEQSLSSRRPLACDNFLLTYEDRSILYDRIEQRVDRMMEQGLLREAETVWRSRERYRTAAAAIGYKEFFPYFEGEADLAACVAKLKQATRNYAKRQITWFKREEGIRIPMDGRTAADAAGEIIEHLERKNTDG